MPPITKPIVNTRSADRAGGLTKKLQKAGFVVAEYPFTSIQMADSEQKEKLLRQIDWKRVNGLFFTSLNGWRTYSKWSDRIKADAHFYTCSKKVLDEMSKAGVTPHFVSESLEWRGFLKEWTPLDEPQCWVHLTSELTTLDPLEFERANIEICNLPVYNTQINTSVVADVLQRPFDWGGVLFCAGSAAKAFLKGFQKQDQQTQETFVQEVPFFVMGKTAAHELDAKGIPYQMATKPDLLHLIHCIKQFSNQP